MPLQPPFVYFDVKQNKIRILTVLTATCLDFCPIAFAIQANRITIEDFFENTSFR